MKDKDTTNIFENYTTNVDTGRRSVSYWTNLISNWKDEATDWQKLDDDMKVQRFKAWVKEDLASRPGGNTVQTDLPNDEYLKKII